MARLRINQSLFRKRFIVGYGLKCYVCGPSEDDCEKDKLEGDKDKYLKECTGGLDRCMRIWGKNDDKTSVANSCTNESGCKLAKEACENPDEGECKAACCEDDECNASSTVSFSVILMAACSVVGLALLK